VTRPKRKTTPRSYCWTMCSVSASRMTTSTTATTIPMISPPLCALLFLARDRRAPTGSPRVVVPLAGVDNSRYGSGHAPTVDSSRCLPHGFRALACWGTRRSACPVHQSHRRCPLAGSGVGVLRDRLPVGTVVAVVVHGVVGIGVGRGHLRHFAPTIPTFSSPVSSATAISIVPVQTAGDRALHLVEQVPSAELDLLNWTLPNTLFGAQPSLCPPSAGPASGYVAG
jgi:hypothetical protein